MVITGAAHGIGKALALRFATEGARAVVTADIDEAGARATAEAVGGTGMRCDVAQEADIQALVRATVDRHGRIDLFCSNAGISIKGGEDLPDEDWERIWAINVKAHIYAARAVLPHMLERGEGYLLQTVSAAGLLSQIGSAPYAVTKHAALAFAEWLAIEYGDRGLKVSALCPQGVRTNMLMSEPGHFLLEGSVSVEDVAQAVVEGLRTEQFLILPHPEVKEYFRRKADDYDRWLRGMRRLKAKVEAAKPALSS